MDTDTADTADTDTDAAIATLVAAGRGRTAGITTCSALPAAADGVGVVERR